MSLLFTISVRRSGEERFVRNTYLAQRQSPVSTPFISPGDGIQYTKTPSCSSITAVLGIRTGLPGNWLVVDEHKVWDYPWRSGDYRKGWRDLEAVGEQKVLGLSLTIFPHIPLFSNLWKATPPAHVMWIPRNCTFLLAAWCVFPGSAKSSHSFQVDFCVYVITRQSFQWKKRHCFHYKSSYLHPLCTH